ncbi:hypothetical protein [Leekyejoonella antrihumi]|uniref:Integral membrane protein n=1 Tax=Leekyejoonella antrihumi TaxID=1660198 RepID=A0A563E1Y4_9MICO|nr:hypothetical protein [Leekyejoonella antrihumi]TWP36547.1 hypothetical protein FGL98_10085 [Leekyejoonella antrihumi]
MAKTTTAGTGTGFGRMLIAVYGLFALAATGRSVLQLIEYFHPGSAFYHQGLLAYLLSAVAAVIYIVATVALARGDDTSVRLARATISTEMCGVLAVGLWSVLDPAAFPDSTVWSTFGQGYGFVPLVLPMVGLWWLWHTAQRSDS